MLFVRNKKVDALEQARATASYGLAMFDEAKSALYDANELLSDVKEKSLDAVADAYSTYEAVRAEHTARHDAAHAAQAKNSNVIKNLNKLTGG